MFAYHIFIFFLLAIALSFLRFTGSDYPIGIYTLFYRMHDPVLVLPSIRYIRFITRLK